MNYFVYLSSRLEVRFHHMDSQAGKQQYDFKMGSKDKKTAGNTMKAGKDGYIPQPFDLSGIVFTEDIKSKVEKIARNVHEVWAAKRMAEGWSYGPERDDEHKRHPCLCRYEDLPESEKEYDRATVESTLKAFLYLDK